MGKVILGLVVLFIFLGTMAAFDFRTRMGASRLGSDVTYALDGQGTASVEVVNKSFFVDAATADNFDKMMARTVRPDVEAFRKSIVESTGSLVEKTGRSMTVADFESSFARSAEFGAQVYRFRWSGFAAKRDGMWVIDFSAAGPIKLTADSSLTIVLPPGLTATKVEPAPGQGIGTARLVWTGAGEIRWPYLEYR